MKNLNNVQQALINIFKSSLQEGALEDLAKTCHIELINLMGLEKTKNFYLAIYIDDHFFFYPYYTDVIDNEEPCNKPVWLKGGLTDYIRKSGKTELIDSERLSQLHEEGKITRLIGQRSKQWIGSPLIFQNRVYGVLAVQTYDSSIIYSPDDVDLIDYVSNNIALAIERKNKDRELEEYKINLQTSLQEKSEEIIKKNIELEKEIAKVKKNEMIQKVLYNISEAKSSAKNLEDLIQMIHHEIQTLMDATNFYVAIVTDKERGLYRFPYIVDENPEELEAPDAIVNLAPGLTHYVLRSEKPLLADYNALKRFSSKTGVQPMGKISHSWMGIPLKTDRGEILGVVVVQSYNDPRAYSHTDKKILSIISTSIADAVKYKQLAEDKIDLEDKILELRKMEAIGILASGIAHEFNNLLSIIMGHSYTGMLKSTKGDPNYKRYEKIEKAGERAAELIEKLLIFAQNRDREKIFIKELDKAIFNVVAKIRQSLGSKVYISIEISRELWPVMIDHHEIDEILTNLLENAIDAVENTENPQIKVTACNFNPTPGKFHFLKKTLRYVQIIIEDNGMGMDKKTMSKIFNPFFTTKDPGKGIGLGLATVFAILKEYDGSIDVESEPGIGSTFNIFLPATVS